MALRALPLLALAIAPFAEAAIYQCTDARGRTIFKDSECETSETLVKQHTLDQLEKAITPVNAPGRDHFHRNPLRNPDFELGAFDWLIPEGAWLAEAEGVNGGNAMAIQAEKPPEDKYIYETAVEQCVELPAGQKFRLSADVRLSALPDKTAANRANVVWYEQPDCGGGGQWGGYIEPKAERGWQHLQSYALTPALGARAAKVRLWQRGRHSNGGTAYWDNIALLPTEVFTPSSPAGHPQHNLATPTKGENYLKNGSFNQDTSGWQPSWPLAHSVIGYRAAGGAQVTANAESGQHIGRTAFSQCVNLGADRQFEAGAMFSTASASNATGGGRLRVVWYQNRGCTGPAKISSKHADIDLNAAPSSWQPLTIDGLEAPATAGSAKLETIQSVKGPGQYIGLWDELYFRARR